MCCRFPSRTKSRQSRYSLPRAASPGSSGDAGLCAASSSYRCAELQHGHTAPGTGASFTVYSTRAPGLFIPAIYTHFILLLLLFPLPPCKQSWGERRDSGTGEAAGTRIEGVAVAAVGDSSVPSGPATPGSPRAAQAILGVGCCRLETRQVGGAERAEL